MIIIAFIFHNFTINKVGHMVAFIEDITYLDLVHLFYNQVCAKKFSSNLCAQIRQCIRNYNFYKGCCILYQYFQRELKFGLNLHKTFFKAIRGLKAVLTLFYFRTLEIFSEMPL